MSKKIKSSLPGEEDFIPTVPEPPGTDPCTLTFAEWSDQEVNAEKWDLPKVKSPKGKTEEPPALYTDEQSLFMPDSINVHAWKRPAEIFPDANFVMYKEKADYNDLVSGSKHLLQSSFMRLYICIVFNLEHLSYEHPWTMEAATAAYTPTTDNSPWKPWDHVYSACKVGKGQRHNPQVNKLDDRLPVDKANHVLLPSTITNPDAKPGDVELWPFILVKALLKLASLNWRQEHELVDFSFLYCFTGWLVKVMFMSVTTTDEQKWTMCQNYTDRYKWPDVPDKKQAKEKKDKKGKGKKTTTVDTKVAYHLLIITEDMSKLSEEAIPGLTPVLNVWLGAFETRDIPLERPPDLPVLPRWKKFRWLDWAVKKGSWPDPNPSPIRLLRVTAAIKKISEALVYEVPDVEETPVKVKTPPESVKSKGGKKGKDKKDKSAKGGSKKSKGSSKGSKKSVKQIRPPDPSFWLEFSSIAPHIKRIAVIFKPSRFENWITVTDLEPKVTAPAKGKDKGKSKPSDIPEQKRVFVKYQVQLKPARNEPLYIFSDSIDLKYVQLCFEQPGLVETGHEKEEPYIEEVESTNICNIRTCPAFFKNPINFEHRKHNIERPLASFVVFLHNWTHIDSGKMVQVGRSSGSRIYTYGVNAGRCLFKLFISSPGSYYLHVLCDTPVVIGTEERINEEMAKESHRLIDMSYQLSSYFGKLVQAFGTPDYCQAMRNFANALKPSEPMSKKNTLIVRNSFLFILIDTIQYLYEEEELPNVLIAMRTLFLDTSFKFDIRRTSGIYVSSKILDQCVCEDGASLVWEKLKEGAATRVQAFMKGIYIRKLLLLHQQAHKDYLKIFNTLHGVYQRVFGVDKRLEVVIPMLRKLFFGVREISRQYYPLYQDLDHVVNLQHISGCLQVEADEWILITKRVFSVESFEPTFVRISLFCDLVNYMVRVFDNDTCSEVKRHTNNTLVRCYTVNKKGYTVVCYGKSDTSKSLPWKLSFITPRVLGGNLITVIDATITQQSIVANYIPNRLNLICRCILTVFENSSATLQLSLSTAGVKIVLRCLDEHGNKCGEISGTNNLVLPLVALNFEKDLFRSKLKLSEKSATSRMSLRKKKKSSHFKLRSISRTSNLSQVKSLVGFEQPEDAELEEENSSQEYIVEAFLVDGTWPLVQDELDVVEVEKDKKLLYPCLLEGQDEESLGSVGVAKVASSKSQKSNLKPTPQDENSTKKEKPLWRLNVAHDSSNLGIAIDKRREEQIRKLKESWYENDPERYAKSCAIREKYLRTHCIKAPEVERPSFNVRYSTMSLVSENEFNIIPVSNAAAEIQKIFVDVEDKDKKPLSRSQSKILPPLDFSQYIRNREEPVDDLDRVLYSKVSDKIAEEQQEKRDEFLRVKEELQMECQRILARQETQSIVFKDWYEGLRSISAERMKNVYNLREKVIDDLIEAAKTKVDGGKKKKK